MKILKRRWPINESLKVEYELAGALVLLSSVATGFDNATLKADLCLISKTYKVRCSSYAQVGFASHSYGTC